MKWIGGGSLGAHTHKTTPIYRAPYNQTPPEFKTTKPQYPLPKQLPETMCIHTNSNPTEKRMETKYQRAKQAA
jgi:hypothetical protein